MNKTDIAKIIAGVGLEYVPGGKALKLGLDALTHRNDDPNDDVQEVAHALVQVATASVAVAEGITGKDYINDPVLAQIAANIEGSIALYQQLLVERHK